MKEILKQILGEKTFIGLQNFKKKILPTAYDKKLHAHFVQQCKFYSQFIRPGDLCFDIGGNVGEKTAVFLALSGRVVVLEPQANCVAELKRKFGKQAVILQKGAGAVNETKDFYVASNSVLSSFKPAWVSEFQDSRFSGNRIERVEKIEIVTIDSLIADHGKPAFVKIDVEGFEVEVVRGLTKPFKCLSFEYVVEHKENIISIFRHLTSVFGELQCNYAPGNNKELVFSEWKMTSEFLDHINSAAFVESSEGDVYVRS